MRFYGATRPTADVDLLIGRAPENARRLYRVVAKLLGHPLGFAVAMLEQLRQRISLRGDGYSIDILTSVDGLPFEAAYARRAHGMEKHLAIPLVSRTDLAFIKRVAAASDPGRREKEQRDIEFLELDGSV